MTKYVILGDSHVAAFLGGVKAHGGADLLSGGGWGGGRSFYKPFFKLIDGEIHPEIPFYNRWLQATGVARLDDLEGRIIISLGTASIDFCHDATWRLYGGGRVPISYDLVETIISDMQKEVVSFYRLLIDRKLIAAVYLAPPPAKGHPMFKTLKLAEFRELSQRFTKPVIELVEAAGLKTLKLDIADDEGLLREAYVGNDTSHAGPAIGPLAIEALKALAAGRRTSDVRSLDVAISEGAPSGSQATEGAN